MERKHPLARCEECPWADKSGFADASGPEDAKVLIIGEAPGLNEIETGKPFTGPSGQLLDKVLSHHGFDRDQIRFTNVVACHPPFVQGKGSTVPPKEVVHACRPRLREELRNRDTIVCLGNTAKEAVLESREPITRVRQGPPRSHPDLPGTAVVATVHPAACLRSSDMFPSLVRDLKKAKDTSAYVKWEPPKWKSYEDVNDALSVLDQLMKRKGYITVDIEVGVEKDVDFTHPSYLLCVGIGYEPNKAVVLGEQPCQDKRVLAKLGALLREKAVICHNGKFDLQVLMRLGVIDEPRLWADTMLASYVLDERPGHHGLKGLASEILGAPDYASEVGKYIGKGDSYAGIPRPVLYRYNAYDAALTYNLWKEHFEPGLEEANLRHLHNRLVGYSNELIYVELGGVKVNTDYLMTLAEEYTESLSKLESELVQVTERGGFNPRSPKQVQEVIRGFGLACPDTTVETLTARFERSRDPEIKRFFELMLLHRREAKLYGTYIKGTAKRTLHGRVYPTYLLHGSVTGRLACRNPNLHNVPRESSIRRLFVPDNGNVYIQGDYKQAELRVIACESKDEYLHDVLSDPTRDIHGEVATRFYGNAWTKEQRVRAKAFVFGVAYGREAFSVAQEHNIPVREAEQYMASFFGMMPKVVEWRQAVQDRVFTGGQALQTHFGRKRRFWLITKQNKMDIGKEALAFVPQSTASDICVSALGRLRREFGYSDTSPKIRLTVHDSIGVECRKADAEEVAETLKKIMPQVAADQYSEFVPFDIDVETGESWGDLHE